MKNNHITPAIPVAVTILYAVQKGQAAPAHETNYLSPGKLLNMYPGAHETFGWHKELLKEWAKAGLLYYRRNPRNKQILISELSFRRLLDFTIYQRHYAKAIKSLGDHA